MVQFNDRYSLQNSLIKREKMVQCNAIDTVYKLHGLKGRKWFDVTLINFME